MAQLALVTSQEREARSHSGYRLVIEPGRKRVRAVLAGEMVADSDRALVMHETGYRPVIYLPREDVRMDLLRPNRPSHPLPVQGRRQLLDDRGRGERRAANAAWSYEAPYEEAAIVKGYIAFYWDRIDAWFEDGEQVVEPPPAALAVTANPLLDWVTREAWQATTAPELIEKLRSSPGRCRLFRVAPAPFDPHPASAAVRHGAHLAKRCRRRRDQPHRATQ